MNQNEIIELRVQIRKAIITIRKEYDAAASLAQTRFKQAKKISDDEISHFTKLFMSGRIKVGTVLKPNQQAIKLMTKYINLELLITETRLIHIQSISKIYNSKDSVDTIKKNIANQLNRALQQLDSLKKKL